MRVSDSMVSDLVTRGVDRARADHYDAQRAASTGLRVEKPSDDPVAAARARGLASQERRAEAVATQAEDGLDRLQVVDGALGSVTDVLSRARELAVQGSNATLGAQDRAAMAGEVRALRQELLSLANTKVEGEHVFSGLASDVAPFDAMGGYFGDPRVREIEVAPGHRVATQVAGDEIFARDADAFATLDALAAALESNDPAAVSALLDPLGQVVDQVADARAGVGVAQQALIQANAVATRKMDDMTRLRTEAVGADPVATFTELMRAEGALREAIAVASRLPPPGMLQGGG